jgi:hypothetical protein
MGQKYAVLISGNEPSMPGDWRFFGEFWWDVVLMREALLQNGFLDNQIYILFGNGADYVDANYPNPRYRPAPAITDFSATAANVQTVFNGLANGAGGFPQMTDDDLLFVWTFDHGCGPPCIAGPNHNFGLMDGPMDDAVFAGLVNAVPHAYRVFCMQQCHSGGFINELRSDRTVILTACSDTEHANPADSPAENEVVGGKTYRHGEFNFHLYCALMGQTVTGTPVNADADGNGFVTMREVFDHIQANESQPETPQYDDGSLDLGEKLHLSFADLHMRDNLQDTGIEPSVGATLCRSPDVNHYRQQLMDPQATLGSLAAQGRDDLFEGVEIGQPNYVYVRVRNRGYSASDAEVDVYWTLPSTLPTPASWHPIGTINVPSVAVDEFKVAGPLTWPSSEIPVDGHYCFVAILGNANDPKPDHNAITSSAEFHDFIRDNNNVVWKNFDVSDAFAGSYHRYDFQIQGWPRVSQRSDLEIEVAELPAGTEVELRILKRLTEGATADGLSLSDETAIYRRYIVTSHVWGALRDMPLKSSDNTEATLYLTFPEHALDGAYELSVVQRIDGLEMGRVTKRIVVGDYPFVANRNSGEVHRSNCVWVQRMSSRNKVAYREVELALHHGYNGCRYCLPEYDTG